MSPERITLWLTLAYALVVPIIAVTYWRAYGPTNFLWLSDIALVGTFLSLLTGSGLLASMMAVGVLPIEIAWAIDFLGRGRPLGLAAYMFDRRLPLYLRCLSLFHLALPPTLIFLLYRFGYDERALALQTLLTLIVLAITYIVTNPEQNINWVFGPGSKPQKVVPPLVYLGLEMVALPMFVVFPTHLILKSLF
jgi:hypothetical protein